MAARNTVDLNLEEFPPEEDSPYLRRSRAIGVRRRRISRRTRRLLAWTVAWGAVLIPGGFAGFGLARFAVSSRRFEIASGANVTVTGNRFVPRGEILREAGVATSADSETGPNLFRMSLSAEETRVESIPWIKRATVVRAFPHHLAIYVTERVPVAFADLGGKITLVDAHGVILDNPGKTALDFPVLRGITADESASERAQQVSTYCEFMRETAAEMPRSGWMVSEVRLKDPDDLQALLVQGSETLLVHFGRRDFLRRFKNFLALLPQLEKHSAKIASVDLRYGNQVVVEPAGPGKNPSGNRTQPSLEGSGLRD